MSDLNTLKLYLDSLDSEDSEVYEAIGDDSLHVIPSGSLRRHIFESPCNCNPRLCNTIGMVSGLPEHYLHTDKPEPTSTLPSYYIPGTDQYPVPFGHYVLIKIAKAKEVSSGGIILAAPSQKKRIDAGMEVGEVVAFGPTVYTGWAGFSGAEEWGISIGDTVEFKKYEGKQCFIEGYEQFHFIPDSLLIGGNRSVSDE